jgi:anti-anti-sigma factor
MDVRQNTVQGVTVLEVVGRVDSTTAPELQDQLSSVMPGPQTRVLVDFSRLEYISSAGFRILLIAAKRANETGGRLALCGVSGKVRQLFDLGGFLDLFTIAVSREEGVAALR